MTQLVEKTSGTDTGGTGLPVLIVGAGPVGVMLACRLLQSGIAVRIVEQNAADTDDGPHSKAILIVPRVLELLRSIGVSDALVSAGQQVPAYRYYSEGRLIGTATRMDRLTDTPYPFLLSLPQPATERVLRARLAALGGTVEHGVSLTDLQVDADGVVARLRHPDGSTEAVATRYLAGADGAASTTRRLLGGVLDGDATDVTYLISDVRLEGQVPVDAQYYYSRQGVVTIIPMRDGWYRLAGNVPHDTPPGEWSTLIQQLVDARARTGFRVGELRYARLVRPRCGVAQVFRTGRAFLLGDAAHVITPAGGQGMNLGIQDAMNLGWKLAGVLNGRLPESVLDSYQGERRTSAVRTARTTAQIIGVALRRDPARALVRDTLFRIADRSGLVQRALTPLFSQLDVNYGRTLLPGPIGTRPGPACPGARVALFGSTDTPDDPRAGGRVLAPDTYTVIAWSGRTGRSGPGGGRAIEPARRRLLGELPAHVPVLDLRCTPGDTLARTLGRRAGFAVVRPDGHLVLRSEDPGEVTAFLRGATLTPIGRPAEGHP